MYRLDSFSCLIFQNTCRLPKCISKDFKCKASWVCQCTQDVTYMHLKSKSQITTTKNARLGKFKTNIIFRQMPLLRFHLYQMNLSLSCSVKSIVKTLFFLWLMLRFFILLIPCPALKQKAAQTVCYLQLSPRLFPPFCESVSLEKILSKQGAPLIFCKPSHIKEILNPGMTIVPVKMEFLAAS